jgi:hypothetical protein
VSDQVHFNTVFQGFVSENSSAPIVFGWVFLNLKKWLRLIISFTFFVFILLI